LRISTTIYSRSAHHGIEQIDSYIGTGARRNVCLADLSIFWACAADDRDDNGMLIGRCAVQLSPSCASGQSTSAWPGV